MQNEIYIPKTSTPISRDERCTRRTIESPMSHCGADSFEEFVPKFLTTPRIIEKAIESSDEESFVLNSTNNDGSLTQDDFSSKIAQIVPRRRAVFDDSESDDLNDIDVRIKKSNTNGKISIVTESLTELSLENSNDKKPKSRDLLPDYDREIDRSRSLLERKSNSPSKDDFPGMSLRDRLMRKRISKLRDVKDASRLADEPVPLEKCKESDDNKSDESGGQHSMNDLFENDTNSIKNDSIEEEEEDEEENKSFGCLAAEDGKIESYETGSYSSKSSNNSEDIGTDSSENNNKSFINSNDHSYRLSDGVISSNDNSDSIADKKASSIITPASHIGDTLAAKRTKLNQLERLKTISNLSCFPDGGKNLLIRIANLRKDVENMEKNNVELESGSVKNLEKTGTDVENNAGIGVFATHKVHSLVPSGRLYAGKMTNEKQIVAKTITNDTIAKIHHSVTNAPDNVETETPIGLTVDLMIHQKHGLTWLLWREFQEPAGGILADDMGLGKTLSMISLIVYRKNERRQIGEDKADDWKKQRPMTSNRTPSHATLVVCPASLIHQWAGEIDRRVRPGRLKVLVFHGPKNKRNISAHSLARYDVVITTYGLVSSELSAKKSLIGNDDEDSDNDEGDVAGKGKIKKEKTFGSSVLTSVYWERVILDEAHQIKNRNSLTSKCCCRLSASSRWCLTGTPIHNELWDLFSLVRFLRVSPFDEEAVWRTWVMQNSTNNAGRLNTMVKGLLIRRTKEQLCPTTGKQMVELHPRRFEMHELKLKGLEKKVYDHMFAACRNRVKEFIKTQEMRDYELKAISTGRAKHEDFGYKNPFVGTSQRNVRADDRFQQMSVVFVLLLRLRQACVHLALTKDAVDMEVFDSVSLGLDEGEKLDKIGAELAQEMANMSLDENSIDDTQNEANRAAIRRLFACDQLSTKIGTLMEHVQLVLEGGDKCVVVSQWTTLLSIVAIHLKGRCVEFTEITGKVPVKDRQERVTAFNSRNRYPSVLLLSLTAGGVGLNLIGGNHLFLVDLHWNPALEQQACDRIYRIGQTKTVFVHKLVCQDTIEQRVLQLQETKKQLAKGVLEGAMSKKLNRLTLNDLKFLFDLGNPAAKNTVPNANQQR